MRMITAITSIRGREKAMNHDIVWAVVLGVALALGMLELVR